MNTKKHKKAIFFDRDGTLIKEKNYLIDPKDIEIEKEVIPALQTLIQHNFSLFIITNQAGIARGYFTETEFQYTQNHIQHIFNSYNILFKDVYYCPHHPTKGIAPYNIDCDCRKPKPGLLLKAIKEHHINPNESYMIGDKLSDIQAGKNAHLKTILVRTGYGEKEKNIEKDPPHYIANTLLDATKHYILK